MVILPANPDEDSFFAVVDDLALLEGDSVCPESGFFNNTLAYPLGFVDQLSIERQESGAMSALGQMESITEIHSGLMAFDG